jgi:hypothetical protein
MPLSVGVVGGVINSNVNYQNMLKLLNNPSSRELAQIMVAIGLAQNFAALRALVSEGIQKGHMGLHARNFAIKAGVPDYLIPDVVNFMKNNKSISVTAAKNYLDSFNIYTEMRNNGSSGNNLINNTITPLAKDLSSFYVEIDYTFLKEPIVMNFLLTTKINPPIHFALRSRKIKDDDIRVGEIFKTLFGEDRHEEWLLEFVKFVNHFNFTNNSVGSVLPQLNSLKYKLKMTIILLYVVSYNLLMFNFNETKKFLENLLSGTYKYEELLAGINYEDISLNFGLSVILELYEIMKFNFVNTNGNVVIGSKVVRERLFMKIEESMKGFIKMFELCKNIKEGKVLLNEESFNIFLNYRLKRLNATVMILADLAFSEENISEDVLNSFLALGKYLEIKITLMRDFKRSMVIKIIFFYKKISDNFYFFYFH